MTVIEVDGVNTKPLTVDSIQIFAGQRYSFVVSDTKSCPAYRYTLGLTVIDSFMPINAKITIGYVPVQTLE